MLLQKISICNKVVLPNNIFAHKTSHRKQTLEDSLRWLCRTAAVDTLPKALSNYSLALSALFCYCLHLTINKLWKLKVGIIHAINLNSFVWPEFCWKWIFYKDGLCARARPIRPSNAAATGAAATSNAACNFNKRDEWTGPIPATTWTLLANNKNG